MAWWKRGKEVEGAVWEEECGKDGADVEILEKDSTQGCGRAGQDWDRKGLGWGCGGAWVGLGWGLGRALGRV